MQVSGTSWKRDFDLLELVLVGQTVADICEQQLQRRGHEGDIYPLLSFSTASEVNHGELRMNCSGFKGCWCFLAAKEL